MTARLRIQSKRSVKSKVRVRVRIKKRKIAELREVKSTAIK